ncbi:nitroreductase family protein [Caulobacter mirabilis]|uniref:Nitroreductase family protein n=1 Tax=Caulobacter mirabilis TaxID=69666 RepID=A0A2D2AWL3_9CAUL|nr:nitroreductase family protein [Caulobacter mirabilis]ATQ42404.1 nitroreductase family protein [Caulobacter mirabilis]
MTVIAQDRPTVLPANPALVRAIERRISASLFSSSRTVSDAEIHELVRLATRAPTAFNLQNWRFIAVRSAEAKARLRALAWDQPKITEAPVTFIIVGAQPRTKAIAERVRPSIEAGFMPAHMAQGWTDFADAFYAQHPQVARDEAIRSATLGAATLMFAAEALGLASGPMSGFDPEGVAEAFGLADDERAVLLVAVGHAAPGNWPQKPRRPVADVLSHA